ncbi:MAG: hypothetical protein ACQKBT_13060, partial [Puniceicoccales bacterium]
MKIVSTDLCGSAVFSNQELDLRKAFRLRLVDVLNWVRGVGRKSLFDKMRVIGLRAEGGAKLEDRSWELARPRAAKTRRRRINVC